MNDLEFLVRDTLTDGRRAIEAPHDTLTRVRREVRRQRRRTATGTAAVVTLVALLGVAIALPMINEQAATYVAGRPDPASGLLPWKPVGALSAEPAVVTPAVEAWADLAADEPSGPVYLVAGERWNDAEVVVLQAETESGADALALLSRPSAGAGPWRLEESTVFDSGAVEAVVVPPGTFPAPRSREQGAYLSTSLILAPEWRVAPERNPADTAGWWTDATHAAAVDSGSSWRELIRPDQYGWLATLSAADDSSAATVVLEPPARSTGVAPVLELADPTALAALTRGEVSLRPPPGESAHPEQLGQIGAISDLLEITGPVEVTVLDTGSGATWVGKRQPPNTETLFAQFRTFDDERTLVAYANTGGRLICFSQRRISQDVLTLPFVGMGCTVPVGGGERRGVQGQVLWADSYPTRKGPFRDTLTVDVTMVRGHGENTTEKDIPGSYWLLEDAGEPVRRYIFTAVDTTSGSTLAPWVWPGNRLPGR